MRDLELLQLSVADEYNSGIKIVDVANQKRGSYSPIQLTRKIK